MRLTDTGKPQYVSHMKPTTRSAVRRVVVSYARSAEEDPRNHESVTRRLIAERLAALCRCDYAGEYRELGAHTGPVYFVPCETLGLDIARTLGIRSEDDLFGGVVPFPFIATKTITHPLPSAHALAPAGWSDDFARGVAGAVLRGYAAFTREDASLAGERLLETGPVRVKPALALGGRGQVVAQDMATLQAAIAGLDSNELAQCGVVVEENLAQATTYSVGQVQVADLVATYVGTQKTTLDHKGAEVYAGSALTVARGGFDALLALHIESDAQRAIEQACAYDSAAQRCFAGFFASRRNYDIARGSDGSGAMQSGVLEQSWRIGGASGAEIAALEAFRSDASIAAVHAECTETYDENALPPAGAVIYFRGIDPEVGFITKYTTVTPYADA